MDISRREFFKNTATKTGAGIAAMMVPAVLKGASQNELATMIDLRKCIGCESCVYACQESNQSKYPQPQKPFPKMYPEKVKVSDWSDKRDVTERLTPYNWLYIQRAQVEHNGEMTEVSIPRRCMHCQNPPCAHLCPFGAAHKENNGITTIDPELCFGGAKCSAVCPWNIPQRQTGVGPYLSVAPALAGNGVMYKCDRCFDKISEGRMPACIEACPVGAQTIGPRDEIVARAKKMADEENLYLYGLDENGGTNTIYVSAVPFDKLNQAIEKGPGKPHLAKTEDTMARTDVLAGALLTAPFAGAVASLTGFYRQIKKYFGEKK